MPSFFALLILSLTLAPAHPRANFRAPEVAAQPVETTADQSAAKPQTVALSEAATAPPAIAILEAAARDLSVQSEIDAPIAIKFWPSEQIELDSGAVAIFAGQAANAPVEIVAVAEFFKNSALIEDWMSDDEKAMARKFQTFVETLEAQLENPRVYLFGERERTVVIIGKVKGGFGGAVTLVVET